MNRTELEIQLATENPAWWSAAEDKAGKINRYVCESNVHHFITTRNVDPGTTPFLLACAGKGSRKTGRTSCAGMMRSRMYVTSQEAEPGWGWYRPESDADGKFGRSDFQNRHVLNGGLLIRRMVKDVELTPLEAQTDLKYNRATA